MDRIKQAKEKLLRDRDTCFEDCERAGKAVVEAKQALAIAEAEFAVSNKKLTGIQAQLDFCEQFLSE